MPQHKVTIIIDDPDNRVGQSIGNDPMRDISTVLKEHGYDYEWNIEFNADFPSLS